MVLPLNKGSGPASRPRAMTIANPLGQGVRDPLPIPVPPVQLQPPSGRARTHQRGASMSSAQVLQQEVAGPSTGGAPLLERIVQYPHTLVRPYYPNIDEAVFRAEFPEFGNEMPLIWLREVMMPGVAVMMLDGITGCNIECPPDLRRTPLPSHVRITFPLTTSDEGACPTHILAVPPPPGSSATRHALFPIHSAWLAVHCSRAPRFPPSATVAGPGDFRRSAVVPVVEYPLPSPDTFPALRTYIYNKDEGELHDYLAPPLRARWAGSFAKANRQVGIIYSVWLNAAFMGVVDDNVYTVINNAWAIVHPVRQEFLARAKNFI